jgi:hypothetical protein
MSCSAAQSCLPLWRVRCPSLLPACTRPWVAALHGAASACYQINAGCQLLLPDLIWLVMILLLLLLLLHSTPRPTSQLVHGV